MDSAIKKVVQAGSIWAVVLVVLGRAWAPALFFPQLWWVVVVSLLANLLQPTYSLLEGSRTQEDRGTAVQIVWAVYISQLAAVFELGFRRPEHLPWNVTTWVALIAMLLGLGLRTWSIALLGRWFTWNVTVQTGQNLITAGPYRYVRHPSYTGALLMFVSGAVLLESWFAAALAVCLLVPAFLRRIHYEEALLCVQLPGYSAYTKRTGKLAPRWS